MNRNKNTKQEAVMKIESIKPHETKKTFKEKGVKVSQVAQAMGLAFTYTSMILTGVARCTPENDRKLWELANGLNNKKKK